MKRIIIFFGLACLLFSTSGAVASDIQRFRITRVYDGDTVMAVRDGVVIYVMLMGIDAPEISESPNVPDQPFGREAKKYLSSLILGKEVEIKGYGRGPYPDNNILGVIFLDGKNINLEMVSKGLAEAFEKDLPANFDITPFAEAEKRARRQKAGMWSLGDRYISPSRWREMHKLNVVGKQ